MSKSATKRTETPTEGRLVRISRVAGYLDVSRAKVYRMMDDGLLPSVKLGKSRRVPWDAVTQLIADNTVGA